MAIVDLAFHPFAYVTIAELADYWRLRKHMVMEHIDAGNVEAIQLGPGVYRVRTSTALAFEQRCLVPSRRPVPLITWRRSGLSSTPGAEPPFANAPCGLDQITPDEGDVSGRR
jgi:hypothetical protein